MAEQAKQLIQSAWQSKNLLFCIVLMPVSWLFFLIISVRRYAYQKGWLDSTSLPVPVVVVGNITVGGSGKTPVVLWLAQQLQRQGFKPAIISRGYGGANVHPLAVSASHTAAEVGDEPVLMERRAPCAVWVGADRVAVGQALLAAHPECNVIICDDGLQHYRLQRTVEIAVVDNAIRQHPYLLPAGPLREPLSRLTSVDLIIANDKADINGAYSMRLSGDTFYNLADPGKQASAVDFQQKSIIAIAGIGKPQRFFDYLRSLSLNFVEKPFTDHHQFSEQDLADFNSELVLMTEKDAVKCAAFAKDHYWVLPVTAEVDTAIMPAILAKLARAKADKIAG